MNFAEYPALAARTEKALETPFKRLEHAALGLATETGEIATVIKRIVIYGKTLDSVVEKGEDKGKTFRQLIAEEIGDVLWYLPIITREVGVSDVVFGALGDPAYHEPQEGLAGIPLVDALASVSRRLTLAAGRLSEYVEDVFIETDLDVIPIEVVKFITDNLVNLAFLIGADLCQIAADNIAKLRARYPDAYSDEAASARADKA